MKRRMIILTPLFFSIAAFAEEKTSLALAAKTSSTRLMISFTDLRWTELPERKGMQFAVLCGDPKTGEDTQLRKVPGDTNNPLHGNGFQAIIIGGSWCTGKDAASARGFGPGSIFVKPGDWLNVSGSGSGSECVFYQEGQGQFDFKPAAAEAKPDK